VLGDRGHLVETPAKSVGGEYELCDGETQVLGAYCAGFVGHCQDIEEEQKDELTRFDDVAGSGDDEPVLVQKRRFPRVVQRNPTALVAVWQNIDE
jgi:hypothetical protein